MTKLEITFLFILKLTAVAFIALFGAVIGIVVGLFLFYTFIPFWKQYNLPPSPEKVISILYVDVQSTLDDPTTDILYIKADSGNVYFTSVSQADWQTLPHLPSGQISQIRLRDGYANAPLIATTEQGAFFQFANGQWESIPSLKEPWGRGAERVSCMDDWQYRPVWIRNVLDSQAIIFDRPVSTIFRCYALLNNGRIRIWVRFIHYLNLLGTVGASMVGGIILGIRISWSIFRSRNRKTESVPSDGHAIPEGL